MLLYPWLSDFAVNTEKFVEHGHRLAGMLIGFVAILLAWFGFRCGDRSVRNWTLGILVAVICQGLLGGARVVLNAQVLAMTHSITGALFFSSCVVFRLLLNRSWNHWLARSEERLPAVGAFLVMILPVIVLLQYGLGGVLRHLHGLRTEHVIGAVITLIACLLAAISLVSSGSRVLRVAGICVLATVGLQVLLGLGSLVARFGFKSVGYVAVTGSLEQAIICSLHTVAGMFLLATCCCSSVIVFRLHCRGLLASTRITGVEPLRGGSVA